MKLILKLILALAVVGPLGYFALKDRTPGGKGEKLYRVEYTLGYEHEKQYTQVIEGKNPKELILSYKNLDPSEEHFVLEKNRPYAKNIVNYNVKPSIINLTTHKTTTFKPIKGVFNTNDFIALTLMLEWVPDEICRLFGFNVKKTQALSRKLLDAKD